MLMRPVTRYLTSLAALAPRKGFTDTRPSPLCGPRGGAGTKQKATQRVVERLVVGLTIRSSSKPPGVMARETKVSRRDLVVAGGEIQQRGHRILRDISARAVLAKESYGASADAPLLRACCDLVKTVLNSHGHGLFPIVIVNLDRRDAMLTPDDDVTFRINNREDVLTIQLLGPARPASLDRRRSVRLHSGCTWFLRRLLAVTLRRRR